MGMIVEEMPLLGLEEEDIPLEILQMLTSEGEDCFGHLASPRVPLSPFYSFEGIRLNISSTTGGAEGMTMNSTFPFFPAPSELLRSPSIGSDMGDSSMSSGSMTYGETMSRSDDQFSVGSLDPTSTDDEDGEEFFFRSVPPHEQLPEEMPQQSSSPQPQLLPGSENSALPQSSSPVMPTPQGSSTTTNNTAPVPSVPSSRTITFTPGGFTPAATTLLPGNKKYRGVSYEKATRRYRSRIKVQGRTTHLGYFATALDAAVAFDREAIQQRHKLAKTNFPISNYILDTGKVKP